MNGMNITELKSAYIKNKDISLKIAIMGSPGSGKSTLNHGLMYFSKLFQFKSDAVPELAKIDYYKNVDMSKDSYEEEKFKRQKELEFAYPEELELLICEAPLIMSYVYSKFHKGEDHPVTQQMRKLAFKYKSNYTHFILTRKLVEGYEDFGRNESQEESEGIHQLTIKILEELEINYSVITKYDEHVPLQVLEMIGAIRKKIKRSKKVEG